MKYYVAYGSNMSRQQMAQRCPGARLISTGRIQGARLEFYTHATIVGSEIKEDFVPVAVWAISARHEKSLDRYEGYPSYYTKANCLVHMDNGGQVKGMVYLMALIRDQPPTMLYADGIRKAYEDLGLSSQIMPILEPALIRSYSRSLR